MITGFPSVVLFLKSPSNMLTKIESAKNSGYYLPTQHANAYGIYSSMFSTGMVAKSHAYRAAALIISETFSKNNCVCPMYMISSI